MPYYVSQVSSLTSYVRQATKEEVFNRWIWDTVTKLHLHPVDQEEHICQKALAGDPDVFARMKDFDLDEDLEFLPKGVTKKKPMAAFLSLSLTQVGLGIPEICQRGFEYLKILTQARMFDHVMEVLNNLIPLFFSEPQSLVEEPVFKDVITQVLAADQTLVAMAKSIVTKEPGSLLKELENVICKQIISYSR